MRLYKGARATSIERTESGVRVVCDDGRVAEGSHALLAIGSVIPSNTTGGYRREDVNMDGVSKYIGTDNDRDLILQTIGGVVPTAVRAAQLP